MPCRSTHATACSGWTAQRGRRPWCRWGFGWLSSSAAAGSPIPEENCMQRRLFIASALAAPLAVRAHHGWSSFDQGRPIWLEGKATKVAWRNPHAELSLELPADLKLPADLASRKLPAQAAGVDGPALLKAAQLPTRKDRV